MPDTTLKCPNCGQEGFFTDTVLEALICESCGHNCGPGRTITGRLRPSPEIQNIPTRSTKATRPPAPRCLTCYVRLSAPTKVPRPIFGHDQRPDLMEKEAASIKALQERRKQEIEEGFLGLSGDGQFCSGRCAEFYGRAAADLVRSPFGHLLNRHVGRTKDPAMTDRERALMEQLDSAVGKFQRVAEVRKKRGPK